MRGRSHRLRLAGVLAALACLFATALAAPTGSAASARLHPASAALAGDAARTVRYWTPERMRKAPPLDAAAAEDPFAMASFAPIPTPTTPPFAVNGRLFVLQGGKQGYCSATAINSPTRRLVLTAAHCLHSGPVFAGRAGVWSRYVEFVPAFTGGTAPFGAFAARRGAVYTTRQWVKTGNPNFDVGAVLTSPNAEGLNVADAVGGGATIVIDATRRQQFQTFGYPGRSNAMQGCESPYVGDDPLTYRIPGPPSLAIRCHWAPGASGGGWLIEEGRSINGVTSYGKRRDGVHTFSPYFSSSNVGRLTTGM
jgi:V8-like Glu-specific endopeptidase